MNRGRTDGIADMDAFEHVFKAHYHGLFRYAYSFLESEDAAEDVIQDVFVSLWESHTHITIQKPYLYKSIRNRCLDVLKSVHVRKTWAKDKRQAAVEADRLAESAEEHVTTNELGLHIDRILAELPEKRREIFIMSRHLGFTYREIAETLGVSENHVKKQMSKALALFRTRLQLFLVSLIGMAITVLHFF